MREWEVISDGAFQVGASTNVFAKDCHFGSVITHEAAMLVSSRHGSVRALFI